MNSDPYEGVENSFLELLKHLFYLCAYAVDSVHEEIELDKVVVSMASNQFVRNSKLVEFKRK